MPSTLYVFRFYIVYSLQITGMRYHATICEYKIIYLKDKDSKYFTSKKTYRNHATFFHFRPRITKIYFKGKYFMLRVRDKNVSTTILRSHYIIFLCFVGMNRVRKLVISVFKYLRDTTYSNINNLWQKKMFDNMFHLPNRNLARNQSNDRKGITNFIFWWAFILFHMTFIN